MVLEDLGSSISKALADLSKKPVIDDEALQHMLNDITRALLSGDVKISLVRGTFIYLIRPAPY